MFRFISWFPQKKVGSQQPALPATCQQLNKQHHYQVPVTASLLVDKSLLFPATFKQLLH